MFHGTISFLSIATHNALRKTYSLIELRTNEAIATFKVEYFVENNKLVHIITSYM